MILPEAEADFEVVEDTPKPPAPVRKPARVVDEDEDDEPRPKRRRDDEEDEEDDRPRQKKGKKKAASKSILSHPAVLIVGGLLGVAVASVALYFVWEAKKKNAEVVEIATNTPFTTPPGATNRPTNSTNPAPALPAGWQTFTPPNSRVTVHVPIPLDYTEAPVRPGRRTEIWQASHNNLLYQLSIITPDVAPKGELPPQVIDDMFTGMSARAQNGRVADKRPIQVGGHSGQQARINGTDKSAIAQIVYANGRVYIVALYGAELPDWDASEVRQFMDSVRITG